jgi:hypothetical protein
MCEPSAASSSLATVIAASNLAISASTDSSGIW